MRVESAQINELQTGGKMRTAGVNGLLASKLIQHLSGTGQSITRLTNANVDDKLLDVQLAHGVVQLLLLLSVSLHRGIRKKRSAIETNGGRIK
jgi:hypothetical protein